MKPSGPFWSADCWRPGRPEQSNPDVKAARKLLLQYRFDDLLDKQRPKIKTPASPPHSRPSSEATILSTTHDPTYSRQYPRSPRAANRANADFDVRRGTLLHQQTPSYGVGNAYRYGRGSGGTQNVGTPTPGSLAGMSGRYRIGERPSPPGARRMPPNKYGTKDDVTRTIKPDAHQFIEQESQTSDNAHRKPALRFQATQPRSKRPSRRQGTMKRKVAELMAKRAELNAVAEVLQLAKVQKALQQADDALESVNNANRFVKGFHSDGKVFDVWERAIQLLKQEQETPITMKALK